MEKGFAKRLVSFRFYSEIKAGLRYPSGGSCAFSYYLTYRLATGTYNER
jgi:hypothetical protein